jgi:hypothetical protein
VSVRNASKNECVINAFNYVTVTIGCTVLCVTNASTDVFERNANSDVSVWNASKYLFVRNTYNLIAVKQLNVKMWQNEMHPKSMI